MTALLDSGSASSLALEPQFYILAGRLLMICMHGNVWDILAVAVNLGHQEGDWPLTLGVIKDLPVPLLIGPDWLGFQQALWQTWLNLDPQCHHCHYCWAKKSTPLLS